MFKLKVENLKRYENSVLKYEAEPIEKNKILFYGSSGFTRWKPQFDHRPLEEDIRMKDGSLAVVNHGFGTSSADLLTKFRQDKRTALVSALLFCVSILCLGRNSVFIYFNF